MNIPLDRVIEIIDRRIMQIEASDAQLCTYVNRYVPEQRSVIELENLKSRIQQEAKEAKND